MLRNLLPPLGRAARRDSNHSVCVCCLRANIRYRVHFELSHFFAVNGIQSMSRCFYQFLFTQTLFFHLLLKETFRLEFHHWRVSWPQWYICIESNQDSIIVSPSSASLPQSSMTWILLYCLLDTVFPEHCLGGNSPPLQHPRNKPSISFVVYLIYVQISSPLV